MGDKLESPAERLKNLIAQMTIKSGNENISYNYFGYIFSRIRRVNDNTIPSIMGVAPRKDGTLALLFNTRYFDGTDDEAMKKVIEHEGMHILNKHIPRLLRILENESRERFKFAKARIWNTAADCAVNPVIKFPKDIIIAGKPFGACYPEFYGMEDGMPAEHYYFALLKEAEEQAEKCAECLKNKQQGEPDDNSSPDKTSESNDQGSKKPGEKDESDDKNEMDGDQPGEGSPNDQSGEGTQSNQPGEGNSPCGDCPYGIGGAGQDYDVIGDHSKWSDVTKEVSDVSSLSRKIDSQIRDIIKDSVKNFKHRRGNLPSHIQELINAALEPPKVPYYQLIQKLIKGSRFSKFKRSLTRINRKRVYSFIIDEENVPVISPFPGKTRDFTFKIVILLDTSGSMGPEDVREGLSGCKNIIENDRHCHVTVLENDAVLHKEYVLKRVNDIDFEIKGRGGTVLRPGIERAKEINPDVMLCFTDGGCDNINDFPRKMLPKKIIWVITNDGETRQLDKTGFIVRID